MHSSGAGAGINPICPSSPAGVIAGLCPLCFKIFQFSVSGTAQLTVCAAPFPVSQWLPMPEQATMLATFSYQFVFGAGDDAHQQQLTQFGQQGWRVVRMAFDPHVQDPAKTLLVLMEKPASGQ
jgi:hypothetical protein